MLDGDFSVFVGFSEGYEDGLLEDVCFRGLLGIYFFLGEDMFYVCDFGYGGVMGWLRWIIMNMFVSI